MIPNVYDWMGNGKWEMGIGGSGGVKDSVFSL
jgi:hypothetical protein